MAEAVIREYCPDDVPELIGLWITVFGDTESFCRNFSPRFADKKSILFHTARVRQRLHPGGFIISLILI